MGEVKGVLERMVEEAQLKASIPIVSEFEIE